MSEPYSPTSCNEPLLPDSCPTAMPCSACGTCVGVTFDADPYDSEVNGDAAPVWLCDDCRDAHAREI